MQQKHFTVVKHLSTTRRLLLLIFATEELLDIQKVKLKDLWGSKSLSPVTVSFVPAVFGLCVLKTSTQGEHVSMARGAAVPHSPSRWLWNLYLAFCAEKSKVAVCDGSSAAASYPDATTCGRLSSHCLMCCLGSSLQLSFPHFMYHIFLLTLHPYKPASYFLLRLPHLLSNSDHWTLKGQSHTADFPWLRARRLVFPSAIFLCLHLCSLVGHWSSKTFYIKTLNYWHRPKPFLLNIYPL